MHIILTGGTGLVGTACLYTMLSMEAITKVTVISRRPLELAKNQPRVEVIIHKDFLKYEPPLLERLKGAHGCIWALGISQNAVPKDEYFKITHDYAVTAARAFSTLSENFIFLFVSSQGARTAPHMLTPLFCRVKGRTEASLLQLSQDIPILHVYSARPGYVDAGLHTEIQPFIPKDLDLSKKLGTIMAPSMRTMSKGLVSPTKELEEVLVELAMRDGKELEGQSIIGEGRTVTNAALREMARI